MPQQQKPAVDGRVPAPGIIAEELRSWAKGSYCLEAATELLIRGFRGRFARPGNAWIRWDSVHAPGLRCYWIAFREIPGNVGALSGGEQRFLMVAASIGGMVPVQLGDCLGFDREHAALVLAAVSHAVGAHEHGPVPIVDWSAKDKPRVTGWTQKPGPLFAWPEASV